jgi:DNA repair exonuclease SbcCD ATPase subunit
VNQALNYQVELSKIQEQLLAVKNNMIASQDLQQQLNSSKAAKLEIERKHEKLESRMLHCDQEIEKLQNNSLATNQSLSARASKISNLESKIAELESSLRQSREKEIIIQTESQKVAKKLEDSEARVAGLIKEKDQIGSQVTSYSLMKEMSNSPIAGIKV